MGTVGPHLGPLKSPTEAKSSSTWSPENRDQPQHPVFEKKEEKKKKNPSTGAVWTPCSGIQKN